MAKKKQAVQNFAPSPTIAECFLCGERYEGDHCPNCEPTLIYCETCHANYQGDQCPGCAPEEPPDVRGEAECPEPEPGVDGAIPGFDYASPDPTHTIPKAEVKPETCKEFLRHSFTADEREEIANEMSAGIEKLTILKGELETIKAQFKSDITKIETQISDAARKHHAGYEMRYVECLVIRDFDLGKISVVRKDTFEVVREREMSLEERQRVLPLEEPKPEPWPEAPSGDS